jgi:AmmeMemoRadiSam system protein B/AmmeMemoRadiSam system protein A
MKIRYGLCAALALASMLVVPAAAPPAPAAERPPAVAGQFYPADPEALETAISTYLSDALPPRPDRPLALVAPHAGYHYSGQIAADAYRQAAGHEYDLVVILGTNHTAPAFDGVSVHQGAGYRTPLGLARIDRGIAAALLAADEAFVFWPTVHEREHSIEVQVPFAQTLFPRAKIVAAVVGRPDPKLCARFGKALARAVEGRKALIVASTDLSHYPNHDDAVAADHATLAAIARMDSGALLAVIDGEMAKRRPGLSTCACGTAPLLAAIEAAKALGATRARVISYANSGDTSIGEPTRVVGYGAVALLAGEGASDTSVLALPPPAPADVELTAEERATLLAFARTSIERWLLTGTFPLARGLTPTLMRRQGAFVTLKKDGNLRGCIGHTAEDRPLGQVVGAMAMQAAFNDRRFRPLGEDELEQIEIEISLLTPLVPVAGVEEIELGRDGVRLTKDGRGALYLPEVAVEQGWNREEMMEQLCRKAGLPGNAWRSGAELSTFRTVLIHEAGEE